MTKFDKMHLLHLNDKAHLRQELMKTINVIIKKKTKHTWVDLNMWRRKRENQKGNLKQQLYCALMVAYSPIGFDRLVHYCVLYTLDTLLYKIGYILTFLLITSKATLFIN